MPILTTPIGEVVEITFDPVVTCFRGKPCSISLRFRKSRDLGFTLYKVTITVYQSGKVIGQKTVEGFNLSGVVDVPIEPIGDGAVDIKVEVCVPPEIPI